MPELFGFALAAAGEMVPPKVLPPTTAEGLFNPAAILPINAPVALVGPYMSVVCEKGVVAVVFPGVGYP